MLRRNPIGWSMVVSAVWSMLGAGCVPVDHAVLPTNEPAAAAATESDADYDTALARVRSGNCEGLFWSTGTCGDLLFIVVAGHVGVANYYDPATGLLIEQEHFTDHGPQDSSRLDDCVSTEADETGVCEADTP